MSRFILFNGAVLVRPGAATKIDASQFENINLGGNGTVAIIGEADDGPPHVAMLFQSSAGVKNLYKSGDIVEAAAILADPGNDDRIPTGAQAILVYKVNASTQSSLTKTPHVFKSVGYGIRQNSLTMTLAVGGSSNERVVTIEGIDENGDQISEVSPSLGGTGKFSVHYVGAGSAATMTISATQLTTTCTGASGDDVSINFADYPTLGAVLAFLGANSAAYVVAPLVSNANFFDPTFLDAVSAVDIKTATYTAYARNFDLLDWINNNSALVEDDVTAYTKGAAGPISTFTKTPLTGAVRGTSDNTAWTSAFTAIGTFRANQVVPLASDDATTDQGTFTYDSILASLEAHCRVLSSTLGRSERQGWSGADKTKTELIAAQLATNSLHVVLSGQKMQHLRIGTGQVEFLPEWSVATAMAGMRAGAPLGEPLTWKYVNCSGISSDSSWSSENNDDVVELELNGITVVTQVRGKGFRIDKCITTYTKTDNDAFTEETIVQVWKNISYELRRALEDRFTGRPGTLNIVRSVPVVVAAVLDRFREEGAITDTVDAQGNTISAYRNITVQLQGDRLFVGVTITPTPGINFVLNTIVLVPASISLAA